MLMSWRDIAVFLDASDVSERLGRQAAQLAREHQAHLVALYGMPHAMPHPSETYARGLRAVGDVIERQNEADTVNAMTAARRVRQMADEFGVAAEFRVVWRDDVSEDMALRSLNCDLIVAATPKLPGLPGSWSPEGLLLATGTPVVMIPTAWDGAQIGRRVTIAWNRSREARRAVSDALPFICAADRVTILTVDADRYDDGREEAHGTNLAEHLSRHGVEAEVLNLSSEGLPVADVLFEQTARLEADLLVMGAYSKPRARELLFGGVTREILARAPVPTLMSR